MEETIKLVADLIGNLGVPGALLVMFGWGGVKLVPSFIQFLEGITASLAKIEVTLAALVDTVDDLKPSQAV